MEGVDFVALLLYLGKLCAEIFACFCKCELFNISLFSEVVDDDLRFHHRYCHIEEGWSTCDRWAFDIVLVDELILVWLEQSVACPCCNIFKCEMQDCCELTKSDLVSVNQIEVTRGVRIDGLDDHVR